MSMKIVFMDHNGPMCKAWSKDLKLLTDQLQLQLKWNKQYIKFSVQNAKLQDLEMNNQYGRTAIVSPGNSLGYLGGGLDKHIGEVFSPNKNHKDAERFILDGLKNGYRPPGTVKIITIPDEKLRRSVAFEKLQANSIIHAPTMRSPINLVKDLGESHAYRLIFDITWQILTEVDAFNKNLHIKGGDRIETIVLAGLGTGYGKIPYEMASKSMLAAIGIFTSHFTHEEKSIFALRYLGYKHQTLLPTPDTIPNTTFDLTKNDLVELFKFSIFNMKDFKVSSH